MPTYHIEDGKMESFNRRLESMRRKLRMKGDTCTCKEIGVEYKKLSDGNTYKFHTMQVEGIVAFEGWNFIARIDHLNSGNIIKTISDIEIPSKYWHTEGYCDHCNTDRPRKTTYLVEKDGVFYQLGKNCVALYTNGLDIQDVCWVSDFIESLDEGEIEYLEGKPPVGDNIYYEVEKLLCYALASIEEFGYKKKRDSNGDIDPNSTCSSVLKDISNAKKDVSLYEKTAEDIISWIESYEGNSTYMNNLKVIVAENFIDEGNVSLLISAIPVYKKEKESNITNEYVGEVGKDITVDVKEASLIYSTNGIYGVSYIYKAIDTQGHTFITQTSRFILNVSSYKRWVGKIKAHKEYNGIKQTVLSRVKFEEN